MPEVIFFRLGGETLRGETAAMTLSFVFCFGFQGYKFSQQASGANIHERRHDKRKRARKKLISIS